MITIAYLTNDEFQNIGFDQIEDFEKLERRAEMAIDLYTKDFYHLGTDFETDNPYRKNAVKKAVAFQIAYLDSSGILTADDKQALSRVTVGRTSLQYSTSNSARAAERFNLSLDAENLLKSAGFGYRGAVDYDR